MKRTSGRGRRLILLWVAASALLSVVVLAEPGQLGADGSYLAVTAGAAAAAWLGTSWLRGSDRLIGALFAGAVTVSFIGDLISRAIGWQTGAEPDASAADVAWLACYVLLAAGLLLLLRRGDRQQRRDADGLIDAVAVFVAGMLVVWELAVVATLTDATLPIGIRVLWGLYPVLDLVMLALVLRLLLRNRTVAALLITVGVGLWLAADFSYLAIADAVAYTAVLDVAWLWGVILIASAVIVGPSTPSRWAVRRRAQSVDETGLGRILLALLPLLVPGVVELQWYLRGIDADPLVTVAGLTILVVLAFLRMARLAWAARAARQALATQERYASALAQNSSDAVVVVDDELRVRDHFRQFAALLGRPDADLRGTDLLSLIVAEDREEVRAAVQRSLSSPGQVFYVELRIGDAGGRQRWLAARAVNLLADPDVGGVVLNLHDIGDRKRAEEELSHQAFHDALTGLANRALFRDRLDHALERSARTGVRPAVVFLDLDGFKTVNDSLGHDAGDELLRQVADRLGEAVRRGDTIGRLGGDEFAVLIEQGNPPLDEATATAERILRALREPIQLDSQYVTVSASLGIAMGERNSGSATLLRDADVAMYRSKATGKNRWTIYRPGMRTAALERLELESGMYLALKRGEFRVLYQPVVDLRSDRVFGFEALLRWHHPDYGLLTPDRFIPLAEETGLIVPLGRWALRAAARTVAGWQRRFGSDPPLTMAVNISGRQLAAPELIDDVTDALTAADLEAGSLVLEITETALVDDAAAAAERLEQLQGIGVQLAIDDFGTGYSSLSYLRHFPVDILKIDRAFVHSIPERGDFPAIVRGLLDLGRTLQVTMLAEGVELDYQRSRLRRQGCELAQGYLFGRPMSGQEAERYLNQVQVTTAI